MSTLLCQEPSSRVTANRRLHFYARVKFITFNINIKAFEEGFGLTAEISERK